MGTSADILPICWQNEIFVWLCGRKWSMFLHYYEQHCSELSANSITWMKMTMKNQVLLYNISTLRQMNHINVNVYFIITFRNTLKPQYRMICVNLIWKINIDCVTCIMWKLYIWDVFFHPCSLLYPTPKSVTNGPSSTRECNVEPHLIDISSHATTTTR